MASIAADHDLTPRVGRSLLGVRVPHLDQTGESDLHLLTRLARDYDAVAKQAGSRLLFVPRGEGESATGKRIPSARVSPEDAGDWRVTLADRGRYRSVRAHWRETGSAARVTETVGSGDPAYTLRCLYPSAEKARETARGKLASFTCETARLSITLNPGNPVVAAEGQLDLAGLRKDTDGLWTCRTVRHQLARGGYKTSVEATLKSV